LRIAELACVLTAACAARDPQMHGRPDVRVPCTIEEGDLDFTALLTTCMYVRERYEVLFGRAAHPVTILVRDTTAMAGYVHDGRVVIEQPGRAAMSRARGTQAPAAVGEWGDAPTWLLDHELGHVLLGADTQGAHDGYGTVLPDWADEAVAIWAESEDQRADRMRRAAALDDVTLDLLTFSTLRHPSVGTPRFQQRFVFTSVFRCHVATCDGLRSAPRDTFRIVRMIDANGVTSVDTVFPEDPEFRALDMDAFYAVASTILPFFHDRGGPSLINTIFDRMLAGRTDVDLFRNLPGLPSAPADVNREWRAFVKASVSDSARSP
jgi:hypothetical protein